MPSQRQLSMKVRKATKVSVCESGGMPRSSRYATTAFPSTYPSPSPSETYESCSAKLRHTSSLIGRVREYVSTASRMTARKATSVVVPRAAPTTWNDTGSSRCSARLYRAGISFLRVRSPVAPKMTIAHGSGVRARRSPSRSGFSTRSRSSELIAALGPLVVGARALPAVGLEDVVAARRRRLGRGALDGMTAELIAQCGGDLHRVRVILPRSEPREERVRQGGRGHGVCDRLRDRPAALAGILDVTFDAGEVGAFGLERALGQLQQPRPHDAAVIPHRSDLLEVEAELARVQELEALAVRLHHSVLDAVVDHLHEVTRPGLAEMRPSVRRRQGVERRA